MKRTSIFVVLLLAVAMPLLARTWKQAASGKEIEAELSKVEGGKVHLKLPDGRTGIVDVISLSLEDQAFLASVEKSGTAGGAQWPSFRGPKGDGISPDTGLLKEWPASGPKQLWVYDKAGMGYSGCSIVDGHLYSMGTRGEDVTVVCVDVATGKELWAQAVSKDDQQGYNAGWGHGPRSTPTVSDGKVYALDPKGTLACLDAKDGKKVWSKHLVDDFGGKAGNWGFSESPFIDGSRLVIGPGGTSSPVVALDKNTGEKLWAASGFEVGGGKSEYSTTVPVDLNGSRQYLRLFSNQLVSLDSETGKLLWTTSWAGEKTPAVIPTPIAVGNEVYISSGYGVGSKLVRIDEKNSATDVWEAKTMKNKHGGMIKFGDHVYGSSEGEGLVCQDWKTGELVWNEKGQFFGSTDSIVIADGMIYCLNDDSGTLSLVKATPDGFEQKGQFKLDPQSPNRNPKGKVWTHPVVLDGKLYLRDQENLVCYDVSAK